MFSKNVTVSTKAAHFVGGRKQRAKLAYVRGGHFFSHNVARRGSEGRGWGWATGRKRMNETFKGPVCLFIAQRSLVLFATQRFEPQDRILIFSHSQRRENSLSADESPPPRTPQKNTKKTMRSGGNVHLSPRKKTPKPYLDFYCSYKSPPSMHQ